MKIIVTNKFGKKREVKGWLLALLGIFLMTISSNSGLLAAILPQTILEIIRWLAWIILVVGCLEAMQIIRIFK